MPEPALILPTNDAHWYTDELIDEMLAAWGAKPRSQANSRSTLRMFAAWLDARGTTLLEATTPDCRAWLAQRASDVAPTTCVKNWTQLVAFYRTAERHSTDPLGGRRSPMRDVAQPAAPEWADTHACTPGEFEALIAAFDLRSSVGLRNAIAVSLMFHSGLRVGELAGIDIDQVDLERRSVHLPITKTGRPRRPPLHPDTLDLLRRYLHPRRRGDGPGPLLVNVGGRRASARLTTNAIQNVIKRAAGRAGVDVSPHALRRGWCVQFMINGGDETAAMTIAGWTSPVMIHRYLADARAEAAQASFDRVAARQTGASREQRALRAVR
jgi:integrase